MAKQRFSDFSGGITDFRFNTSSNFASIMDNWEVLRDKSMQVRWGFGFWDIGAPRIPTNERVNAILDVSDTLCFFSNGRVYYNDAGFQEIIGPTGNKAFNLADTESQVDAIKYGDQYICVDDDYSFPQKLFKDQNGDLRVINAGLPTVISDPVVTPTIAAGTSYVYAFVYEYYYRVGTTLFLDLGTPRYVTSDNSSDLSASTNVISDYLELTNGVNRNYDEAGVKKRIYRTEDGGTTFYLVGTIDNNVTSYVDNTSDLDLVSGEVLYTQGGVKDNDLPPQCKYIAASNNIVYYGNIIESAETKPYRLRFSKIGDPDSVPDTFFEDFDSEITGLSSVDNKAIVFTDRETIALEGVLDDVGRGTVIRRSIGDIGCVSNGSIVTTQDYIYWFSTAGIYRTNGVTYEKLTNHLDLTYQLLTENDDKKRKVYSAYDDISQRVYWCVNFGSPDNNKYLVYDEINKGFITWSSGLDFSPTSLIWKDQEMVRADADGYVFLHNDSFFSDLVKSDTLAPADWWNKAIPYEWKHIAWTMGDSERVKWLNKVSFVGRPETNVYLEPRTFTEGNLDYLALAPVRFNPLIVWGEPEYQWGDPANRWNSIDYLNIAKRFHRRGKRATHLQLALASAYVTIQQSVANTDSYVSVDSVAKTVSMVNPGIYSFDTIYEGYDIIIDGKSYQIQSGSTTTLVVTDPDTTLVNGNYPYEIKGYPKQQRPQISDISVYFEVFGDVDKLEAGI